MSHVLSLEALYASILFAMAGTDEAPTDPAAEAVDDEERWLVAQIRRGGPGAESAFQALVERHQTWLVHFLMCLVGSQADAEDVAQEVFVRAFLALDRFRGDAQFKTWIRRIAVNQAFNYRRGNTARTAREDEVARAAPQGSMDGTYEAREALALVLAKLSYPYREALVLYHVENQDVASMARTLDLGESAVKMRLKRAREQFIEIYERNTRG